MLSANNSLFAISLEYEMDLAYVKKLIRMLSESDVDEIEIEEEGKKVRRRRNN